MGKLTRPRPAETTTCRAVSTGITRALPTLRLGLGNKHAPGRKRRRSFSDNPLPNPCQKMIPSVCGAWPLNTSCRNLPRASGIPRFSRLTKFCRCSAGGVSRPPENRTSKRSQGLRHAPPINPGHRNLPLAVGENRHPPAYPDSSRTRKPTSASQGASGRTPGA